MVFEVPLSSDRSKIIELSAHQLQQLLETIKAEMCVDKSPSAEVACPILSRSARFMVSINPFVLFI